MEIENLRKQGCTYREIAEKLNISVDAVKSHLRRNKKDDVCAECGNVLHHTDGYKKRKFCSNKCSLCFAK